MPADEHDNFEGGASPIGYPNDDEYQQPGGKNSYAGGVNRWTIAPGKPPV
jgi:hypothetical protein